MTRRRYTRAHLVAAHDALKRRAGQAAPVITIQPTLAGGMLITEAASIARAAIAKHEAERA